MMEKWKIGTVVGAVWGLISLITLSRGTWLNPLIRYTFGLPTLLAFRIADIWNSYIVLFLLTPIIGALIGALIGFLIDKYKRDGPMKNKKLLFGIILVVVVISALFGTFSSEATIKDAYCDLDGNFTFTIQNRTNNEILIDYKWTLNDPKADKPVYEGEGFTTLQSHEKKSFTFKIHKGLQDYIDARYFVIYVYLYKDGKHICKYREQKSPFDWDYSVLPPVKLGKEIDHVFIAFETFISRNENEDFIVQIENMSYNPPSSPLRLQLFEFYLQIGDKEWRTSEILSSPPTQTEPMFVDQDGNGFISDFDYYIIPNEFEEAPINFETVCAFVYRGWDWKGDILKEEDRDAIIIKNISTNPESPQTLEGLEFIIDVQSKNGIDFAEVEYVICQGKGVGSTGRSFHINTNNAQNYICSAKFDDVCPDFNSDNPNPKMFYITIRDHDVNERLVLYELIF